MEVWAPTIVGTMSVKHKTPTNLRTYGLVNGERSQGNPMVRREIWIVFTEDAAAEVSLGSKLGTHMLGRFWARLPAGGGGPVPPDDAGKAEYASRFEPIQSAASMTGIEFVAAIAQGLTERPYIIVDAVVTVYGRWADLNVYQTAVPPGRVEECFDKAITVPPVRERAYLMARKEEPATGAEPLIYKPYVSLYAWRSDGFPEDTFDSKAARPFAVVDIPHTGDLVMESDWKEWALNRLSPNGGHDPTVERAAVCEVKVYRDGGRDAYIDYVMDNGALP